jgi:hypothetical protein
VPHERFDAAVVRVILLRQNEPTNFARLSTCVRRDGLIMLVSLQTCRNVDSIFHKN